MADEPKPEQPPATIEAVEVPPEKKSLIKKLLAPPLLFVVIGVLVVVIGAAVFFLFLKKGKSPPAKAAVAAKAESEEGEKKSEPERKEKPKEPAESEPPPEAKKEAEKPKEEEKPKEKEKEKEPEKGKEEAAPAADQKSPFKFDAMVVNIFDRNAIHYLKMQLEGECNNPEVLEEINQKKAQLRDRLLFLVGDRSMREILSAAGKTLLKEDIQDEFNKVLKKGKVINLYFTDFAVQ